MNASSLLLPDGSMDVVIEKGTLDSLQDVAWKGRFGIPSGKHTKNDGKSPVLMGKSTING